MPWQTKNRDNFEGSLRLHWIALSIKLRIEWVWNDQFRTPPLHWDITIRREKMETAKIICDISLEAIESETIFMNIHL